MAAESITLVWKPGQVPGTYHGFLLYNDGTNEYYVRAGNSAYAGDWLGGSGFLGTGYSSGPGLGPIVVFKGLYELGTPDFAPPDVLATWTKQIVISDALGNLLPIWNNIVRAMDAIHNAKILYDPVNIDPINSNSAIMSALAVNGLALAPSVYAPGWNTYLQPVESILSDGTHIFDTTYAGGSTHATLAPDQTADAIHKDAFGAIISTEHWSTDGRYRGTILDPSNTQLWNQRSIDADADHHIVADNRDYSDVANQWLVNHTLPTTNLWQADEGFALQFAAEVERLAFLGNIADMGAPSPLSYESYFGSGYDFSANNFAITPGATTTVGVQNAGFGFDVAFSGGDAGPNTFKVGLTIPLDFFDFFSFFDGLEFDIFGPVILDLSGGAIDITPRHDSNVFFDIDGDGYLERTAWAGPGDGLLAIDLHGSGGPGPDNWMSQALEIAFARWTADPDDTDLEALATVFDTNQNGQLDPGDARWGEFRVWQDANQNGLSETGELRELSARGISSIGLTAERRAFGLPDGSRIERLGTFAMNGATFALADAALAYDPVGFKRVNSQVGFNYLFEDGTVEAYLDAKVAPAAGGGVLYNQPIHANTGGANGLFGGRFDDVIHSTGVKPVTIFGDAGNDQITGGLVNDVLDGGVGRDVLFGIAGDDTIYFDVTDLIGSAPGTTVNGGAGYDTGIFTTNTFSLSIALGAYELEALISHNGNDNITANPNAAAFIDGREGDDTINGSGHGDTLVGGAGNDTISGAGGGDMLSGSSGNDVLHGGDSEDVLLGGPDNDDLHGDAGNDIIDGGDGHDRAFFSAAHWHYVVTQLGGGRVQVSGPDGTDVLISVEQLVFNDPPPPTGTTPTLIEAHDFNGDGRSDILWHHAGGQVSTWEMASSAGPYSTWGLDVIPLNWRIVGAGDFNGDGRSDLLWRADTGEVGTWQMAHGGAAAAYYMLPTSYLSWHIENTGDFNGDGRSDILWRNDDGSVAIWEMASAAYLQASLGLPWVYPSWHIQGVNDFDGDGRSDILWRNDSGEVAIWQMANGGQASGYFGHGMISTGSHIQGTGDFNGDGRADILWRGDDGQLSIWLMANSGQAQSCFYVHPTLPLSWQVDGLGDYNGDGRSDILIRNDNGSLGVWEMGANGQPQAFYDLGLVPTSWQVQENAHFYMV